MNEKEELFEYLAKKADESFEILKDNASYLNKFVNKKSLKPIEPYTTLINEHPALNVEKFDEKDVKFILQSIEIENFKSIRNSKIDLANCSFVSGYNSSGKSAHTQLILLLIQWLTGESFGQRGAVPLNGPYISLGDDTLELINRSIQEEFEKLQKEAFEESPDDFNLYGGTPPLVRIIFNFTPSEKENLNQRSIIFSLGVNDNSDSSFLIQEITIKDTILDRNQIYELSTPDLSQSFRLPKIKFSKDDPYVHYIKSFKNLKIKNNLYEEKLIRMELVGNNLAGNAAPIIKENTERIKSFFKEEVVVNDKSYSINSTNCSKLSLTSRGNPLGEDGQISMLLDQTSAVRFSLFSQTSMKINSILNELKFSDNLLKKEKNKNSKKSEILLETIEKIKDTIQDVFQFEIQRSAGNDKFSTTDLEKMLYSVIEDFDYKIDEFMDMQSIKNNAFDLIAFVFSLNSEAIKLKNPSNWRDSQHFLGGDNFARKIRDYLEGDESTIDAGPNIFETMYWEWVVDSITTYISILIDDMPESLSTDTRFVKRRLKDVLLRELDPNADLITPGRIPEWNKEEDSPEDMLIYNKDVNKKFVLLLANLRRLINEKIENLTSDIKSFQTVDIKNDFVLTEAINKNVTDILDDLLNTKTKKLNENNLDSLDIEAFFLLLISIPDFHDLNTMNNVINEFSIIESDYKKHYDSVDYLLTPSGEKVENLDYIIMSSYTIPDQIEEQILIKNNIPLFNTSFLNSSRGYTDQSQGYAGKEFAPLGINGEYTASYLFLYGKNIVDGPDIRLNSPNYILNLFEDVEFQRNSASKNIKEELSVNQTLLEHINDWMFYIFGIKEKISVRESGFGRNVLYFGDDLISNVGSGISQALPIIVSTIISKDKFIFLEEVEQNLHASAQAKIADMVLMFSLFDRRFLVETHSDHLLNRLRLRCIQLSKETKLFNNDLLNIYFIKHSPKTDSITQYMAINEKGQFSSEDIDKGFFDQSQLDTLSIIKELKEF